MLRQAIAADIGFVAALQALPENRPLIAEEDHATLAGYLGHAERRLLIWEKRGAPPSGFALIEHKRSSAHRAQLIRLCLAQTGQGLGQEVIAALLQYVFAELDATRFWLDVAADNTRARRAYERAGFRHEGTLQAHWRRRTGDLADLAIYGLLRRDWQAA